MTNPVELANVVGSGKFLSVTLVPLLRLLDMLAHKTLQLLGSINRDTTTGLASLEAK